MSSPVWEIWLSKSVKFVLNHTVFQLENSKIHPLLECGFQHQSKWVEEVEDDSIAYLMLIINHGCTDLHWYPKEMFTVCIRQCYFYVTSHIIYILKARVFLWYCLKHQILIVYYIGNIALWGFLHILVHNCPQTHKTMNHWCCTLSFFFSLAVPL